MGQRYEQIKLEERCQIASLRASGRSIRQIAAALDRAPSTVARELKRNSRTHGNYKPAYADQQGRARRWTGSKLERNSALREKVLSCLARGWSPEQIAGRFTKEEGKPVISHETIYRFIYAQIVRTKNYAWRNYLPRRKFKRGRRGQKGGSPASFIAQRRPLSERPIEVNDRTTPGHWEADLMLFRAYGQAILTLHERQSRLLIATRPSTKAAEPIIKAIKKIMSSLPPQYRKTITFDNGTEFARHYQLHHLDMQTFFCDTHAPWQKGGIENAIGRMRRKLPRKTDLVSLTNKRFNEIVQAYNNTPRKCLDFYTPIELFIENLLHFKCESTFPLPRE
jgi:transposase, IS30 family